MALLQSRRSQFHSIHPKICSVVGYHYLSRFLFIAATTASCPAKAKDPQPPCFSIIVIIMR